jgi:hypothetical protein
MAGGHFTASQLRHSTRLISRMLLRPTMSSSNLSGQISPKPRHDYGVESRRSLQLPTAKGQQKPGKTQLNVVIISTNFF